jgi:hypothetical protein
LEVDILEDNILEDDILEVHILEASILEDDILEVYILEANILEVDILEVDIAPKLFASLFSSLCTYIHTSECTKKCLLKTFSISLLPILLEYCVTKPHRQEKQSLTLGRTCWGDTFFISFFSSEQKWPFRGRQKEAK